MASWRSPRSREVGLRWKHEPRDNPLWLLTRDELDTVPTTGAVTLVDITGARRMWRGPRPGEDIPARDFPLPEGDPVALTTWGVRESDLHRVIE